VMDFRLRRAYVPFREQVRMFQGLHGAQCLPWCREGSINRATWHSLIGSLGSEGELVAI